MLPTLPFLLSLVVLQGTPDLEPAVACEDSQRIDLTLTPSAEAREICVSPGMMTGFLFDTIPGSLELQEEVRFVEVLRGQRGISFVPPKDMMPGERLRLTVRFGAAAAQEIITFILVAHRGQATRQVEVYRDKRPQESYQQEALEERAKNQQLRNANQQLQVQLERARGLRSLIANGIVGHSGVQTLDLAVDKTNIPAGVVFFDTVVSYRAGKTVVAETWLSNFSAAPWNTIRASLLTADNEEVPGVQFLQLNVIAPTMRESVILEVNAESKDFHGEFKLMLWDETSRVITFPGLRFP
ncbi:MAG TPA: DUF2381 family protein [Archangium sp.]|uniref:DUF2381 family protein n=1 Tax=Archangium sp. TaxID=1872627 RepID=UPI002E324699|nr:DUF2381 family protein [Archangium sp.]HEX5745435.1 DUF2381 family protein [Archangium sp.]